MIESKKYYNLINKSMSINTWQPGLKKQPKQQLTMIWTQPYTWGLRLTDKTRSSRFYKRTAV